MLSRTTPPSPTWAPAALPRSTSSRRRPRRARRGRRRRSASGARFRRQSRTSSAARGPSRRCRSTPTSRSSCCSRRPSSPSSTPGAAPPRCHRVPCTSPRRCSPTRRGVSATRPVPCGSCWSGPPCWRGSGRRRPFGSASWRTRHSPPSCTRCSTTCGGRSSPWSASRGCAAVSRGSSPGARSGRAAAGRPLGGAPQGWPAFATTCGSTSPRASRSTSWRTWRGSASSTSCAPSAARTASRPTRTRCSSASRARGASSPTAARSRARRTTPASPTRVISRGGSWPPSASRRDATPGSSRASRAAHRTRGPAPGNGRQPRRRRREEGPMGRQPTARELYSLLRGDPKDLVEAIAGTRAADVAAALRDLPPDAGAKVLAALPFDLAVQLFDGPELEGHRRAIIQQMDDARAAPLIEAMSADQRADLFRELPTADRLRFLGGLDAATRAALTQLLRNRVLGVVTVDDVIDAIVHEQTEDAHKFGGMEALDEPYTAIGFGEMIRKRAGWLCALFLSEMLTATAMQHFEGEISRAVVLAMFIPLVMSSGGNSGSQATSLVIRALALGEVSLRDWWRVARREIPTGLTLGAILGAIGLTRIELWQSLHLFDYGPHHRLIALTVGAALVGIVGFGSLAGSMLPFLLQRLGFDPASASAPFVATLVDVTGLVIYFSVAFLILRGTLL